jgi:uncharacterized integral membrane protein
VGRLAGAVGVLLLLVLAMAFATLNGGQRVTVRLGFATFYGVPLTLVAFTGLLLGMLIMLVAGIRSDLKVRRILRDRLVQEGRDEAPLHFVDRSQQDLFADGPSREAPETRP